MRTIGRPLYKTIGRVMGRGAQLGSKLNQKIEMFINGTGQVETDVTIPLILHSGVNPGIDNTGRDVFLNNKSENDFSDVAFYLGDTKLDHYIVSHGNYEVLTKDNTNIGISFIDSSGIIWAANTANQAQLQKSSDGGNTFELVYTASDTIRAIFVDSRNYIFISVYTYGVFRSTDGGTTFSTVIDMTDVSGFFIPAGISENINGDLYIGRYQTIFDVKIYKSTDDGENWSIVYEQTTNQHVHSVQCDPFTGYIYAGLDGSSYAIVRSIDNGANWTVIYTGNGANAASIYCGDGYRLFGSEPIVGGTIIRTTDDSTFDIVLNNNQMCSWIYEINGILFASGESLDKNVYPTIYKSEDDGVIWESIRVFDTDKTFGGGYHHLACVGTPIGETNPIILLGHRNAILGDALPSMKIKSSSKYEALCYLLIPTVNADTTTISIKTKETGIVSSIDTFKEPVISDLALHYKLNEGSGTEIIDSSGNGNDGVLTLGTGAWNGYEVKRIGAISPPLKRSGDSIHLNGDGYITVTGSNTNPSFHRVKNFTAICWINNLTSGASKPIFEYYGSYGWKLYFLGVNFSPALIVGGGATYAVTDLGLHVNLKDGYSNQIGLIITNDTPAKVKFIINGMVTEPLQLDSDIVLSAYTLKIGHNHTAPYIITDIDEVRWYNRGLTDLEVKSLYESRKILDNELTI